MTSEEFHKHLLSFEERFREALTTPQGDWVISGNTKNIGSIKKIDDLIAGQGTFSPHNKKIFDDYWMNYLTRDMSRAIDSPIPYRNLDEYFVWRQNLLK